MTVLSIPPPIFTKRSKWTFTADCQYCATGDTVTVSHVFGKKWEKSAIFTLSGRKGDNNIRYFHLSVDEARSLPMRCGGYRPVKVWAWRGVAYRVRQDLMGRLLTATMEQLAYPVEHFTSTWDNTRAEWVKNTTLDAWECSQVWRETQHLPGMVRGAMRMMGKMFLGYVYVGNVEVEEETVRFGGYCFFDDLEEMMVFCLKYGLEGNLTK